MGVLMYVRIALVFISTAVCTVAMGLLVPELPLIQLRYLQQSTNCATDGNNDCAGMASALSGLAHSLAALGSLLLSPVYGGVSDRIGRRPLVCWGLVGALLPYFTLLVSPMNLAPYYILTAFSGLAPSPSVGVYAALADLAPAPARLQLFGWAGAGGCAAFAIGAALSGMLSPSEGTDGVVALSVSIQMVAAAVFVLALPETAPTSANREALEVGNVEAPRVTETDETPRQVIRAKSLMHILLEEQDEDTSIGEKILRRIAWIGLIAGVPESGVSTIALFYAQARFGFTGQDMSFFLFMVGISGCLWQTIGLWILQRVCPDEGRMFQVALAANFLHCVGYIVAWSPEVLFLNMLLTGGAMAQPMILRAFASRIVGPECQGRASGVLSSVAGACYAVAPALFGTLFSASSEIGAPVIPFALSSLLLVFGGWLSSLWLVPAARCQVDGGEPLLK